MPHNGTSPDIVLELAKRAEATLSSDQITDMDVLDTGLGDALEAARHLRAQVDLGGAVPIERLLSMESLLRSTLGVQPTLQALEIDGALAAHQAEEPVDEATSRAGALRTKSHVATQAVLSSLQAAYRVALDTKETPWPSK